MDTDPTPLYDNETGLSNFPLYEGPRSISAEKKADLVSLCEHLPIAKREFYKRLKCDGGVADSGDELELDGPVMDAIADVVIDAVEQNE